MCLCEAGQLAAPLVLERGASGDLDPAETDTADDPDQDGIEEGNTALVRAARGALARSARRDKHRTGNAGRLRRKMRRIQRLSEAVSRRTQTLGGRVDEASVRLREFNDSSDEAKEMFSAPVVAIVVGIVVFFLATAGGTWLWWRAAPAPSMRKVHALPPKTLLSSDIFEKDSILEER